ncbi:hypothetical protein F511_36332 [Dorcoceras hygrometricum]|uniref:Uncharacterized protein n=1 Tax=Dorcoceras hygrometricum TaxID=472368 RepID=A0A2Z7AS13_9LAMI|nr:hypothetical protein F511_36332 [Dorcoceras hygrometricum]
MTNAWTAAHPRSNVRPSPRKSIGLRHPPPEANRPTTGHDARPARISFASSSAQRRVIIGRPCATIAREAAAMNRQLCATSAQAIARLRARSHAHVGAAACGGGGGGGPKSPSRPAARNDA